MVSPLQISLFRAFAAEMRLEISKDFLENILKFCELILENNKRTNLVSKNDEGKLLTRHIADSLVFACYCGLDLQSGKSPSSHLSAGGEDKRLNWADIGSGAGFPVIPLAFYFPQVNFFAVENRRLRCEFLNDVKQKLNIENLQIVKSSAESSGLRNMDFVSCRAVGSLKDDWNKAKEMLGKGYFLTLKSKRIIDEMQEKHDPLLAFADVIFYNLPLEEMEYAVVRKKAKK